jgi:hypothetical protein
MLQRLCFWISIKFEPERGRVVHVDIGVHVADVVVPDQVQRDEVSQLYQRGVTTWRHVCQLEIFFKSELIFTIVYNKLKNDLRLLLTNTVKELEE